MFQYIWIWRRQLVQHRRVTGWGISATRTIQKNIEQCKSNSGKKVKYYQKQLVFIRLLICQIIIGRIWEEEHDFVTNCVDWCIFILSISVYIFWCRVHSLVWRVYFISFTNNFWYTCLIKWFCLFHFFWCIFDESEGSSMVAIAFMVSNSN